MAEPIACRDVGVGVPLVLIHGGFSDGVMAWSTQLRTLVDRFRLLVVDRRGHGDSPREPRPYTFTSDARDVLAAMDRAGVDRAHLGGHSYGALVAIEIARRAPARVASLHLVEPPYLSLLPDDPEVRPLAESTREMARHAGERSDEATALAFFSAMLGPSELSDLRARPAWTAIVREARRMADEEFVGDYPASAVTEVDANQVRVYAGGRSHPGMRALARAVAEAIPGGRLVEVADAGHVVQRTAAFDAEVVAVAGEPEPPPGR